jgi:hypothetical protein
VRALSANRPDQRQEQNSSRLAEGTAAAAETLRSTSAPPAEGAPKGEEKMSLLWRVFGGTLLSILALAAVTVYTQFNNGLNDLRGAVNHAAASQADLVKKEEFNARMTSVWNGIKEAQGLKESVTALKERSLVADQEMKEEAARADSVARDLQALSAATSALRERAILFDHKAKTDEDVKETLRKELRELTGLVTLLKERMEVQDQRIQQEIEHKEMIQALHQLRERLAVLEMQHKGPVPVSKERTGDE